jgi:regulatory protein
VPEDIEQLKKAREYAFLLLRHRPRSVAEFTEKLKKRGFDEDISGALAVDFKKRGLLDDARFAKMWLEDRMLLKPMGKFRLRQELKNKGISEFDIDDAMSVAMNGFDEYEAAKTLAKRRLKSITGPDKIAKKRRLTGFLLRRGFSYEIATKIVREVIKK